MPGSSSLFGASACGASSESPTLRMRILALAKNKAIGGKTRKKTKGCRQDRMRRSAETHSGLSAHLFFHLVAARDAAKCGKAKKTAVR